MEELKPQLTESDIRHRTLAKLADEMKLEAPEALRQALAEEELFQKSDQRLKHVPEHIFVKDVLPAVSGELGEIDMVWWRHHFGSVTVGFFVVDASDKVLFEFPALAPSPGINNSKDAPPVGNTAQKFRNSAHLNMGEAVDRMKQDLRGQLAPSDGVTEFIENIARVERICRRYGKSIVDKSKPELQTVVNAAVDGLNDVFGDLGTYGVSAPKQLETPAVVEDTNKGEAYDDDGQASSGSFD